MATKNLSSPARSVSLAGLLGLEEQNTQELIGRIQAGLPFSSFDVFHRASGISKPQIASTIVLKPSTMARRKKSGYLSADQSERLVRLAKVSESAVSLFEGDVAKAREWMEKPRSALGGKTPLEMTATELGAREVENLILRLEDGTFS
ncbi:MAG TPA: antitoxin Xre/MbcA/ParS toxin-binding domain-containing protein [Abditibacterium sp.]